MGPERYQSGDAAWQGKVEEVKILLANGADVNLQDKFGDTALKHASRKGHEAVVKILLTAGAEVNKEPVEDYSFSHEDGY